MMKTRAAATAIRTVGRAERGDGRTPRPSGVRPHRPDPEVEARILAELSGSRDWPLTYPPPAAYA